MQLVVDILWISRPGYVVVLQNYNTSLAPGC